MSYTNEEFVYDLIDSICHSKTLEDAYMFLGFPILAPDRHKRNPKKSFEIFMKLFKCIRERLGRTSGCLEGAWEDILKKTLMYSDVSCDWETLNTENEEELDWLSEMLQNPDKCPNPYIRLELFRLIRIFNGHSQGIISPKRVCNTFIQTICELQPYYIYPTGDKIEMLFCITDMIYIINWLEQNQQIKSSFATDIHNQFNENTQLFHQSRATRFLIHCIQLTGVFALNATYHPNHYTKEILGCCKIFKEDLVNLYFSGKVCFNRFQYIISHQPFHSYAIEAIHDVTTAILDRRMKKPQRIKEKLLAQKDEFAASLGVCINPTELTRLLMNRQLHGNKDVYKHSLAIKH